MGSISMHIAWCSSMVLLHAYVRTCRGDSAHWNVCLAIGPMLPAFMEWRHTFICRLHARHIMCDASACLVIVNTTQSLKVELEYTVEELCGDKQVVLVRCLRRRDALCISVHHQLEDFVGVVVVGGTRSANGRGFPLLHVVAAEPHRSIDWAHGYQAPRQPRSLAGSTAVCGPGHCCLPQHGCWYPSLAQWKPGHQNHGAEAHYSKTSRTHHLDHGLSGVITFLVSMQVLFSVLFGLQSTQASLLNKGPSKNNLQISGDQMAEMSQVSVSRPGPEGSGSGGFRGKWGGSGPLTSI